MVIGVDVSRAVNEKAGIGRYTREVVSRLIDLSPADQFRLLATFVRDEGNKQQWLDDLKSHRDNLTVTTAKIPGQLKEWLWGKQSWKISRYLKGSEVIFAPSFFEVALGEEVAQVVMIHDMAHALFPDQRGEEVSKYLAARSRAVVAKAVKVIVPSHAVENDLLQDAPIEKDKIAVIPEGYNEFFKTLPKVEREPFFLFVGTLSPRKNLVGLCEAFAKLPAGLKEQYRLKIVGAQGWNMSETMGSFQHLSLQAHVDFLGFKNDEELRLLYNQAAAFLFPSLYEGFGIPILEAMACGCPVVTSQTSSMPEVAGEAALLVDPRQPLELARAMEEVVTEPKTWARLHKSGLTQAKKFSWDKCAERTLEVLHNVGRQ